MKYLLSSLCAASLVFAASCSDDDGTSNPDAPVSVVDAMNAVDAASNVDGSPVADARTNDASPPVDGAPTPDGMVPDAMADAMVPDAMVPDAMVGTAVTISNNDDPFVITTGALIGCPFSGNPDPTLDNSHWRRYDLAGFGITSDFNITEVQIGIELAFSGGGAGQPANVRIYSIAPGAPFTLPSMTLIHTEPITIADQTNSLLDIPLSTTLPAGQELVVRIELPNGVAAGDGFYLGHNNAGQQGPSWISSNGCAMNITDLTTLGAPGTFGSIQLVSGTHIP